jgi:DNA-binding MarR family transcriptional regulator
VRWSAYGLNGGEFDVLASLRRSGPPYRLSPTALSSALIVTSGGMTKRLRLLESRGPVRRDPDPGDRRSTLVTLTPEGMRLVDEVVPVWLSRRRRLRGRSPRSRRSSR